MGVGAAIAGAAVVGAGSSIITGNKAAKASKQAAEQSAAVEKYIYDQTREDNAPWRDVGIGALGKLATMYGIDAGTVRTPEDYTKYVQSNPDLLAEWKRIAPSGQFGSMADYGKFHYNTYGQGEGRGPASVRIGAASGSGGQFDDFFASPDYQFRLNESIKALDRSASARGRLNSGALKTAVLGRAGDLASSEYNNYANRLAALAGVGQSANAANQQAGQQYASGMTQAITNAGNARASSYANTGAAINNTVGTLASAYLYNQGWGGSRNSPGAMS